MKKITTIQFKELTPEEVEKYDVRKAARAIVFDSDRKIGLLYVAKHEYHKLPGGGIEDGEDIIDALKRECLEELGCSIEVDGEVGEIVELRDELSMKQYSYCYLANVVGKKGESHFDEMETARGFQVKWATLDEAIKLLENDKPKDYRGMFIQARDSAFLKEAKNILSK